METTLLTNGLIITMNDRQEIITQGAIFIEDNLIAEIGSTEALSKKYSTADNKIDVKNHIILPGFINAHCHCVATIRRFLGSDLAIMDWLRQSKWPFTSLIGPEEAEIGATLGILENLRFGNTTIIENYYSATKYNRNADAVLKAAQQQNIRCILAHGVMDNSETTPPELTLSIKTIMQDYQRLLSTYHRTGNGRCEIALAPVNLLNTTPELLIKLQELGEKEKLFFHTHVSEGKPEVDVVERQFGKPYVEVFADYNCLNRRFHAAHGVWLSPKEIQLLSDSQATVVYNPASNMYLASGVCQVSALAESSVNIAMGTDSPPSNATLDLMNHLNLACLLQKVSYLDPRIIRAYHVLEMVTKGGARAIGMEDKLGSLEPGKIADIITVDMQQLHLTPVNDPVAAIVYGANGTDVSTVLLDGKLILKDKQFIHVDPLAIIDSAKTAVAKIQSKLAKNS